jgi:hypothetical protein
MIKFAIMVMGFPGYTDEECPIFGQLLVSFDFDADNGRGYGEFDPDPNKAKLFDTLEDALEFWRTSSPKYPWRLSDGRRNRPLTASSVSFVRIEVNEKGEASFDRSDAAGPG